MMSGKKVDMYVKQLSHNGLSGFIIPRDGDTYRIQIRLKIDEAVYNTLLEQMTSPYITVLVDGGMVVGIDGVNTPVDNECSMEDRVIEILSGEANNRISKKRLFGCMANEFGVSTKTVQRTMNEIVAISSDIKMTYNEVYLCKK